MTDRRTAGNKERVTATATTRRSDSRSQRHRFARLYRDHFGLLWSAVHHMGVSTSQREDVLQDVWLRVYRRMHTLDSEASTKAWLCSIARNVVRHHHRSSYRRHRKLASLAAQPEAPPEDLDRRHCARTTASRLLSQMDADQRTVLVLAQVHGLSGPEIAEGLGIPLNTTYSRLRLARRAIEALAANADDLEHAEHPPAGASQRTWSLLLPCLPGSPLLAPGATKLLAASKAMTTAKIFATTAAISTGVIGLVAVAARADAPPTAASVQQTIAASTITATSSHEAAAARPAEATVTEMGPIVTDPLSAAPPAQPAAAPAVDTRPAPLRRKAAQRSRRAQAITPPVAESPTPQAESRPLPLGLAEENALIRQAQAALRKGKPSQALATLGHHKSRFPSGQLADSREGLWVRALCDSGRTAEARARADALVRRSPTSPVADVVVNLCRKNIGAQTE